MTPQLRLVTLGAAATLISKYAFGKEWQTALLFGFAAISTVAVLTAHEHQAPAKA